MYRYFVGFVFGLYVDQTYKVPRVIDCFARIKTELKRLESENLKKKE